MSPPPDHSQKGGENEGRVPGHYSGARIALVPFDRGQKLLIFLSLLQGLPSDLVV